MPAKRVRTCSGVMSAGSYWTATEISFPETPTIPLTWRSLSRTSSNSSTVPSGVTKSPFSSARAPPGVAVARAGPVGARVAVAAPATWVGVAGGRVGVLVMLLVGVAGAGPVGSRAGGLPTTTGAAARTGEKVEDANGTAARAVTGGEVGCAGRDIGVR